MSINRMHWSRRPGWFQMESHHRRPSDAGRSSSRLPMHFNDIELTTETYDDDVALRAYVFKHFRHLMTPLERRTLEYSAPIVSDSEHWKVRRIYDFLEERDGHVSDDAVVSAFAIPYADRKKAAIDQVLANRRVFQNRCPQCMRLARTPVAKQCMWCGHDWH